MELELLHAEWIGMSLANLMRHHGALRFCQTATGNNTGKSTICALYSSIHSYTRMHIHMRVSHGNTYEGRHGQRVEEGSIGWRIRVTLYGGFWLGRVGVRSGEKRCV